MIWTTVDITGHLRTLEMVGNYASSLKWTYSIKHQTIGWSVSVGLAILRDHPTHHPYWDTSKNLFYRNIIYKQNTECNNLTSSCLFLLCLFTDLPICLLKGPTSLFCHLAWVVHVTTSRSSSAAPLPSGELLLKAGTGHEHPGSNGQLSCQGALL